MTELELLDGDFRCGSPERDAQEDLAERLARNAGWYKSIFNFVNKFTGHSYRASDMDGWTDLCGNEGIIP